MKHIICPHTDSGCNYPESECRGLCTTMRFPRRTSDIRPNEGVIEHYRAPWWRRMWAAIWRWL